MIQAPLQGLIGSPIAIVIVAGLNGLAWWFGIHPTVVNSMLYPILYANAEANQALADIGNLTLQTGNIGTVQMLDQIGTIGGSGLTIGFVLSLLLVSRSSRMKAMLKVSFIPSLFNINEPIIFGVPVMFNPLFLIPMTLAPVIAVIITYVSMAIGFMPMFVGRQAPWAMLPVFSGIMVSGWQCAVTQVVVILVAALIYYPFVKVLDQQYYNELIEPDATYLLWLDFRELGLSEEERVDLLENRAGIWLSSGLKFGEPGEGFERINIACFRSILAEALGKLEQAVAGMG